MHQDDKNRPVLLVVMGTSGCGKSTFGEKLAQSYSIPFIDGDDLHPKNNVEKMSRGEALNDQDRMPWLQNIRNKAMQVTHPVYSLSASEREKSSRDEPEEEEERIRELAEVFETSQQNKSSKHTKLDIVEPERGEAELAVIDTKSAYTKNRACVIACSALKSSYRDILRGEQDSSSSDLHVIHIYLHVKVGELRRRMHQRKGHFMKESMLQSQLDTLEEPFEEKDTITFNEADLDDQIDCARLQLREMLEYTIQ